MAELPGNPRRLTPYPNFRFRLLDGTHPVPGFSQVSDLTTKTTVVRFRSGSAPAIEHLAPGQTECEPITVFPATSRSPSGSTRSGNTGN